MPRDFDPKGPQTVWHGPQEPTVGEDGWETHPAFGTIEVNRAQVGPTGAVLFDSEIRHNRIITVRLYEAKRKRELNHDRIFADSRPYVEVEMSEAQWASFVSSFGQGGGVSCTIRRREDEVNVPGLPYAPRMEHSLSEVRGAADRSLAAIREAFEKVKERPNKGNIRHLENVLDNAPSNMTFAAKSLTEHAENVVQKAKADMEAMVLAKAEQLGLTEAQARELMPGDET